MFLNVLTVKNILRSPLISVLPSFLPGVSGVKSKFGTINSVSSLVPQTANYFQFRSFSNDQEEKNQKDASTEEEWKQVVIRRLLDLYPYHEYRSMDYFDLLDPFMEGKTVLSMEKEMLVYRERFATYRLIHKIEDVARRLLDDNVDNACRVFYLIDTGEKWLMDKEINYDECWLSLITCSKQPLAEKLMKKLKETDITPSIFSLAMKKVYCELKLKSGSFHGWSIDFVDFGPEDIVGVLYNLPLDETDLVCMKILFNLDEPAKWHIDLHKTKKLNDIHRT